MATTTQRAKMHQVMDLLVAHEPAVHYREDRPMHTRTISTYHELAVELAKGISMDCSESVTLICRLGGLKDPNGLGFNGTGNTQVMYDHLPHYVKPQGAAVGALVFFGIPGQLPTQHVCMVYKPGGDPLLFSHGQERGPVLIRLSDESKYHEGHPVFLSIAKL